MGIADPEALERRTHDPVHRAGDHDILPHLARLSAVRLPEGMDPGLSEQARAPHLAKVARYPEWGQALEAVPEVRISSGG